MKHLITFIIGILCFSSCSDNYKKQYEEAEKQITALKIENERLLKGLKDSETIIEGYRNSPQKLLASATQMLKEKNLPQLLNIKNDINKYHPESSEATQIGTMYDKLNTEVEREKEAQRKREIAEKEAAEKRRMQAVTKMKKNFDDVSGITWYENPYFIHYNNINATSIYIGKNSSSTWLRLKMSYAGDDWIFFENALLSYDGNTQKIYFDEYKEKKSDNSGGGVWEWIDISVDNDLLSFLRKMVNGKSPKMRLSGKYTKTHTLSAKEINAIKDVLLAYDVLMQEN